MTLEERKTAIEGCYEAALSCGLARNKSDFSAVLGVSRTAFTSAMNGNGKYLTDSLVSKAIAMVRDASEKAVPSEYNTIVTPGTLKVIPVEAMAGTLSEFAESVREYDCERMVSPVRGADYAMKVSGESMSPEYPNGSIILIKQINEQAFIEWGKVYVLDTPNGAVIKQIRKTEDDDSVECVSLNRDFQPFRVRKDFIRGWYRVLMVLSTK